MAGLEFTEKQVGEQLTVFINGRIDAETSPQLNDELKLAAEKASEIVLDFEGVSYISSSGLRVLLGTYRTMSSKDGQLMVRRASPDVADILELTGFVNILGS